MKNMYLLSVLSDYRAIILYAGVLKTKDIADAAQKDLQNYFEHLKNIASKPDENLNRIIDYDDIDSTIYRNIEIVKDFILSNDFILKEFLHPMHVDIDFVDIY